MKPCPFCGKFGTRLIMNPEGADFFGKTAVCCTNCGASGPPEFLEDAAVLSWNNRGCKRIRNKDSQEEGQEANDIDVGTNDISAIEV